MMNAPKISVIIPLYNAEQFIGECLESLLAQTFQDFEVIIVDDCATDSSPAIVESYAPKFNGRLKISRQQKNSGTGATGRNKGLLLSRGEYVFNMDNDDLLTLTALEELYTLAKIFDADVVYCEKYYAADNGLNEIFIYSEQVGAFVDKPTFETENLTERVQKIMQHSFLVMPWTKFIRRDLLIEHEIIFPNIIRDDDIWTWNLLFHAKKFLRVPNVVYIWRQSENSIMRKEKTPRQEINFWLNPVILGLKILDEVLSRVEFFRQNPQHRYAMLLHFVEVSFIFIRKHASKLPPFAVYDAIREKFSDVLDRQDVLIPLLCSFIAAQQQIIADQRQRIEELEQIIEEKF